MRNWEEMKDFSYVGIKITKAKTISQGLTRCKIQKLSRNNPVYQHLILHKKYRPKSQCEICINRDLSLNLGKPKDPEATKNSLNKRSKTEQVKKVPLGRPDSSCERQSCHFNSARIQTKKEEKQSYTPRENASREGQRMKNVIDRFDK